ncbi:hypothetical protein [Paenibacillus massiliensis]|uniref:hypothetical protein n=1 Tax=Paenibacillus massiliensis TaxID=225917 RepID=UPI0012EB6099|nr:hypothetical protein [Paenibacillus massiliensis]
MAGQDTGGLPAIAHYYGDYRTYSFRVYNDFAFWTSWGPAGSHVSKNGVSISNNYVSLAMANIDAFATNHNNMRFGALGLVSLLGTTVISIPSVIAALSAGGATALQAGLVYENYNAAQDNIKKAYNYVSRM